MLNDLLNSLQRDGAITGAVSFIRSFAGILSGPVAFVTSRASSTDWTSLTVSVNSDISGEPGALAALPDERRGGGKGLFSEYFQLKILTAYDYLGERMHWLILASRLDQELYAIWNSGSIQTKNALSLC